jgi:hypothetical protein
MMDKYTPDTMIPVVPVNGDVLYSWKFLLFSTFAKAGPWALLCAILLGVIWYEVDKWVTLSMAHRDRIIIAQERYIAQSEVNVATLQKSVQVLTETVTDNTKRFSLVADNVEINQKLLETQNHLMEKASTMMESAPERSKRTLAVLERMEKLLERQDLPTRGGSVP